MSYILFFVILKHIVLYQYILINKYITGACHRCTCPKNRFLEIKPWQLKTTRKTKQRVLAAASGETLSTDPVVEFTEGQRATPGPACKSYERTPHCQVVLWPSSAQIGSIALKESKSRASSFTRACTQFLH
jgi:hypothetical protein